jgi:hypothetical protein
MTVANETCIDCKAALTEVVRPEYLIKARGKTICPLPRCSSCRAEYEKIRVGTDKGLELIVP